MNNVELKFKTNIKCGGCIETVKPFLNNVENIEKWEVNTTVPEKILTVNAAENVEEEIVTAVKAAGYTIEKIQE
jgi:copper chaperone